MRALILFCLIACCAGLVIAQPGDPGGDPDNPIPITGVELLIGAGAALGVKKLWGNKNKK
ncbi:MAG: hypothetical protein KatS3mg032_0022 [Cyclobacteriaceae bacterium]|nr:MAG: hypothetical protein KatS3mg032_0022 [Cyclobacteriaceae bacterium]